MEIKTIRNHYRNIVNSDYLASNDVRAFIKEHGKCILTIDYVSQHLAKDDEGKPPKQHFRMNGQKGNWNIVHFREDVKDWVCNSTNTTTMLTFVKDKEDNELVTTWAGITIQLAVDESIEFHNNKGGIIVLHELPVTAKPKLTPGDKNWQGWKTKVSDRINEDYAITADLEVSKLKIKESLLKHFDINEEDWLSLCAN